MELLPGAGEGPLDVLFLSHYGVIGTLVRADSAVHLDQFLSHYGVIGTTNARGGQSCHNLFLSHYGVIGTG